VVFEPNDNDSSNAGTGGLTVRIYLDASALNRPFDDQRLSRNRLEAAAVLAILEWIETGKIALISSAALVYENMMSPLIDRREYVTTYLALATSFVAADPALLRRATEFEAQGMRPLDALHLASIEFLRGLGQRPSLATYDQRLAAAAEALTIPLAAA